MDLTYRALLADQPAPSQGADGYARTFSLVTYLAIVVGVWLVIAYPLFCAAWHATAQGADKVWTMARAINPFFFYVHGDPAVLLLNRLAWGAVTVGLVLWQRECLEHPAVLLRSID